MRRIQPGKPGHLLPTGGSSGSTASPARNHRSPSRHRLPADIWRKCHALLDDVTPLLTDCGFLCDARCCKGGSDDGMLLFPGEESLFAETADPLSNPDEPGGWRLTDSKINVPDTHEPVKLLVCNGQCDRRFRPMACRMFPLLPWMDRQSRVRIRPDLRAFATCPLLSGTDVPPIRPAFAEAVREAFEEACLLPGTRFLLEALNNEASLLRKFYGLE